MKIFALPAGEDWVCDRFVDEWRTHCADVSTDNPYEADILWLLAGWCWNHLPPQLLQAKKTVLTVHHIDPTKFDEQQAAAFKHRDQYVDVYHVPCGRTSQLVRQLTTKPIFIQPFWTNQRIWRPLDKDACREKHGLPNDKYLVGSFQRDTEGHDLTTPKLAKGPDVFVDVVKSLHNEKKLDVEVVLAGWRRQYVMRRLDELGIKYTYFQRPPFDVVNELYNALDLYVVGSRYEGGPQAIFECAATQTPIISTPVGYAEDLLGPIDSHHIFEIDETREYRRIYEQVKKVDTRVNFESVMNLFIPTGFDPFMRAFTRMMNKDG